MADVTLSDLRHVFRFQKAVKAANTSGGQTEDFDEHVTTRGYFRKMRGGRQFITGMDTLVQGYEAWCYWRTDIEDFVQKDWCLVYDNRNFRIESMERVDEERGGLMHFELTESS